MSRETRTLWTLLLLGAVFLSLNALAVSARPGEIASAETTTAARAATAGTDTPVMTSTGPVVLPVVPPPPASPGVTSDGPVVWVPIPGPVMNPANGAESPQVGIAPSPVPGGSGDLTPTPGSPISIGSGVGIADMSRVLHPVPPLPPITADPMAPGTVPSVGSGSGHDGL